MQHIKKTSLRPYLMAIAICLAVGMLGSIATSTSVDTWYPILQKPAFNPPAWLFAPVWTILYIMMGIAWGHIAKKTLSPTPHVLFMIQLLFNGLWSFIFFGAQQIGFALLDIILLAIFLLATIISFFRISTLAGYLLLPYLLWVIYAATLNFFLWRLN